MTKKQKKCEESYQDSHKRTLEMLNAFPVRYATLDDAMIERNPLLYGYSGYEHAEYEQRIVQLKP